MDVCAVVCLWLAIDSNGQSFIFGSSVMNGPVMDPQVFLHVGHVLFMCW